MIAEVHGGERISTAAEVRADSQETVRIARDLAEIQRLLRDQPREHAVAMTDALALMSSR